VLTNNYIVQRFCCHTDPVYMGKLRTDGQTDSMGHPIRSFWYKNKQRETKFTTAPVKNELKSMLEIKFMQLKLFSQNDSKTFVNQNLYIISFKMKQIRILQKYVWNRKFCSKSPKNTPESKFPHNTVLNEANAMLEKICMKLNVFP